MTDYQLTEDLDIIINLTTGTTIPKGHRWWNDYTAWLSLGNIPKPAIDTSAIDARALRNGLLRASDWTQIPDNTLTGAERTSWAAYRQLLRDVPNQSGFPNLITWPTVPVTSQEANDQSQQS